MFFFILLLFIDWLIYFSFHFSSSFFLRLPFLLSLLLFYLLKLEKTWASFVSCTWQKQSPLHPFFSFSAVSGFPIFIRVVVCGFLSGQSTSTLSTTFFQFIFFIWLYMPPFFLSRLVLHCSNISNRFSSSRFLPCTKSLENFF